MWKTYATYISAVSFFPSLLLLSIYPLILVKCVFDLYVVSFISRIGTYIKCVIFNNTVSIYVLYLRSGNVLRTIMVKLVSYMLNMPDTVEFIFILNYTKYMVGIYNELFNYNKEIKY